MNRYIVLLRGINVGGHKKILMADLRNLFEDLGFTNVRTYIQTGNIIFDYPAKDNNITLARKIEKKILNCYDFEVPVMVRTNEELNDIVNNNPYWKKKEISIDRLHLSLLEKTPTVENLDKLKAVDYSPDQYFILNKCVYLYCTNPYHNSKLSNNYIENKLKTKATTRNWKTILKLLELSHV